MYLSQIYTNHSIRATGATILGRNCSMAQIMAVTRHKSASSVAVYQRRSNLFKNNGTAVEHGRLLNCSGVCDGINCCKSVIITK
jgi:hypothetical protein